MLHVCVSATLYKPLEECSNEPMKRKEGEHEESSRPLTDTNASNSGIFTNSTYLTTCDDASNKKLIEPFFLEESKNRLNDYYNTNKIGLTLVLHL